MEKFNKFINEIKLSTRDVVLRAESDSLVITVTKLIKNNLVTYFSEADYITENRIRTITVDFNKLEDVLAHYNKYMLKYGLIENINKTT